MIIKFRWWPFWILIWQLPRSNFMRLHIWFCYYNIYLSLCQIWCSFHNMHTRSAMCPTLQGNHPSHQNFSEFALKSWHFPIPGGRNFLNVTKLIWFWSAILSTVAPTATGQDLNQCKLVFLPLEWLHMVVVLPQSWKLADLQTTMLAIDTQSCGYKVTCSTVVTVVSDSLRAMRTHQWQHALHGNSPKPQRASQPSECCKT